MPEKESDFLMEPFEILKKTVLTVISTFTLSPKGPAIYPQEFPKGTQFSTVIDSGIFIVRELL